MNLIFRNCNDTDAYIALFVCELHQADHAALPFHLINVMHRFFGAERSPDVLLGRPWPMKAAMESCPSGDARLGFSRVNLGTRIFL